METSDQRAGGDWDAVPLLVVEAVGNGVGNWFSGLDDTGSQLLIGNNSAERCTAVGAGEGYPNIHGH